MALAIVFFVSAVVIKYQIQEKAWREAIEQNTSRSYSQYISNYTPNGKYLLHAYKLKEESTWREAIAQNDIEGYISYSENYPMGNYASQSKFILDTLIWNKYARTGHKQSLIDYKYNYESGLISGIYWAEFEEIQWRKTQRLHSIQHYRNYINEFPKGNYVKSAERRIQRIKENQKNGKTTRNKYKSFMVFDITRSLTEGGNDPTESLTPMSSTKFKNDINSNYSQYNGVYIAKKTQKETVYNPRKGRLVSTGRNTYKHYKITVFSRDNVQIILQSEDLNKRIRGQYGHGQGYGLNGNIIYSKDTGEMWGKLVSIYIEHKDKYLKGLLKYGGLHEKSYFYPKGQVQ